MGRSILLVDGWSIGRVGNGVGGVNVELTIDVDSMVLLGGRWAVVKGESVEINRADNIHVDRPVGQQAGTLARAGGLLD